MRDNRASSSAPTTRPPTRIGRARIGLYPGQSDWGYAFLLLLGRAGLVWNIALPEHLAGEGALTRVAQEHEHEASPFATFAEEA